MTENEARTVVIVGSLLGAFVWILGFRLYLKMKSLPHRPTEQNTIKGKSKDEAMRILLKEAATMSLVTSSVTRIVEKTDDSVTLQLGLSHLRFRLESEADGTSLNTEMNFTRLWRVMGTIMAALVLFLQPLVIIGIFSLLWFLAVPNNNPNVRWQVVQVVHVIHVLWPPFLVYFLFVKLRGSVKTLCDNLAILIEVSE